MKTIQTLLLVVVSCAGGECVAADRVLKDSPRTVVDFNFDWQFGLQESADSDVLRHDSRSQPALVDDQLEIDWTPVTLPHDWSIRESYRQKNTAASTGFLPGGIGWYQKAFSLPESDRGRSLRIEFDGVYCKSDVWINGHHLGFRPSGYSSFSYDLTPHLRFGSEPNRITVRVDHSAYVDSRWYTGSGIYRNVRLVKTSPVHVPQWGVQITTPQVTSSFADILVTTKVVGEEEANDPASIAGHENDGIKVATRVVDGNGVIMGSVQAEMKDGLYESQLRVLNPSRWSVDSPNLAMLITTIRQNGIVVDRVETKFGIRTFEFGAHKGFSLNGMPMKIRGVNLHHDAGALGAAVPKSVWEYRVGQLKSIGVNAIRMSHNPHSVELMDVCDQMGMLVMDEFFDEWYRPKVKSLRYIGDQGAKDLNEARGYSEFFERWAERDLKDLIRRDFNHPSVIMWSIGNEIEWTFPAYSKAFTMLNPESLESKTVPVFDPSIVKPVFDQVSGGDDPLAKIAKQLSAWVKEVDTSRPVTCGSVRPSLAAVSGYLDAVDVAGFNYRAECYDAAHETYPEMKIIGSENWGAYSEWKNVLDRDFVSGMFAWTGFAYLGEAGPWPRKGLNLSFFDYAGFKTPRGHFFECLWKDEPKVYMVTTPSAESEYSFSQEDGWQFEMQIRDPPFWGALRKWEWYRVNEHWDYQTNQDIVVQVYTNCDETELFLNNKSLGKQALSDFPDDHVIKWLVPYTAGELSVKGYAENGVTREYTLATSGEFAEIELSSDKKNLKADGDDVAHVRVRLLDAFGRRINDPAIKVQFQVNGEAELLAVDNGWEMNVDPHYQSTVLTHNGQAMGLIRSGRECGRCEVIVSAAGIVSKPLSLEVQ